VLAAWLTECGADWCNQITLATLDPAAGYRAALLDHLPNATRVLDHFHALKLANAAIDDVRRRVQQEHYGHRGRKSDPLYRARRVFLTAKSAPPSSSASTTRLRDWHGRRSPYTTLERVRRVGFTKMQLSHLDNPNALSLDDYSFQVRKLDIACIMLTCCWSI
jgi:transposase